MTAVFTILASLIVITPVLTIIDSMFVYGLILANAATATALIALTFHAGDLRRLAQLVEPIAPLLLIPCAWMLVQIMPIPSRSLAHSAWASASGALGKPLVGAISLDIGTTLLSLSQYALVLSVAMIATAVALDRHRAEVILLLLTASTIAIAAGLLCLDLGYFHTASADLSSLRSQAMNVAAIGTILSATNIIHISERARTHPANRETAANPTNYARIIPIAGLAICLLALMVDADAMMLFATACGLGVLMSVVAIRKWRLGLWGQCGLAAAIVIGLVGFFSANPNHQGVDPTLWFSTQPAPMVATADRILADAGLSGTGAGTFEAVLPIYRDTDSLQTILAPATTALVATEMGRPFLYGLIIVTVFGAYLLFRRALLRGRDYYYAGCGAGCIVAMLVASFANAGLFYLSASILLACVLGMAFAQSKRSGNADGMDIPAQPVALSVERTRYAAGHPTPTQAWFRTALLVFSAILASLSAWIIVAEYYRPARVQLLADRQINPSPGDPADQRNAKRSASIARVRGDLWAESAFTHSNLLWREPAPGTGDGVSNDTRSDLENAIRYAPHRGDVWLMLAAMADRYHWQGLQPAALLKMSYYTAPNELVLFPLRFQASLQPNNLKDPEIQDLIKRDIRLVVTKVPALKPALIAAYRAAPPASRTTVERLVSEIDPTYLAAMRAGLQ
ncbi:O-antigen ligase family protein [Bradyrhizobium sp. SYSU BS000235]|uniref:O-antigen ligase family protein n=1 Tax=Bradyrhizobium sp. SYSU BS000235 TaxID=3411332 RepID=UPI003C71C6E4